MVLRGLRRLAQECPQRLVVHQLRGSGRGLVLLDADAVDGAHGDALARVVTTEEPSELDAERGREGVAERGEEDASPGMRAREVDRAVQRDDGLPGAGGPGDAGRTVVATLDDGPLGRVEEDRPLLPRVVEGALQLVGVLHEPEPPLSVGVVEGIRVLVCVHRRGRRAAGGELEQCLGGLAG